MSLVDLLMLVFATVSLTRLLTHDDITEQLRRRVLRRGDHGSVMAQDLNGIVFVPKPKGPRWEPVYDQSDRTIGWFRGSAWYVRMLRCARYCAPFWAAAAVSSAWLADRLVPRGVVLALALRSMHATIWPIIHDQFPAEDK